MGSHARALSRLAAAVALTASLFGATEARAQSMDPSPERLVNQPSGLTGNLTLPGGGTVPATCQSIAMYPSAAAKRGLSPVGNYACQPDNVAFKNLVSEFGSAVAPSTMHGARTVGFGGFVLSLEAAYTHVNSNDSTHANSQTGYAGGVKYWQLGTQGQTNANGSYNSSNTSPDSLIGVYTLMVRKGLPLGFEIDGALGYVQDTSLWTLGADVRWAILEGFRTGALGYVPDIAVGTGARTVTGSNKMYLTTLGVDVEVSKPITLSDSAVLTPYLGYQHLVIFGNSEVLDSTPNVNALQQCGYTGRNSASGAPNCSNTVAGSGGQVNDGDFNNNITFAPVQLNRERMFVGATYRYELLYLGAQMLFDIIPPSSIDADLDSSIQWTISLQAGVFF